MAPAEIPYVVVCREVNEMRYVVRAASAKEAMRRIREDGLMAIEGVGEIHGEQLSRTPQRAVRLTEDEAADLD